jgi:hypothetical protein
MAKRSLPFLILVLFWLAFVLPIVGSGDRWGIWDWDHHMAFAEVERSALVEHLTVPLWNPYVAGGTVLLQHPLSSFLCPDFVLVLLFGVPFGLKLLLAIRLAAGLTGGYALGRALEMTPSAAALASILLNGSGAYTAHVAFGHFEWTLLGYVPWVLLGVRHLLVRGSLVSGAMAALGIAVLYLGGGIYLVFPVGLLIASSTIVWAIRRGSVRPVLGGVAVITAALLLSSAKLLPSWEFFREHPRRLAPMISIRHDIPKEGLLEIPKSFAQIFLAHAFTYDIPPELLKHADFRRLREERRAPPELARTRSQMVEEINYHAYVGLVPLVLLPFAFALRRERWLEWAVGFGVLSVIVLSDAFSRAGGVSPWAEMQRLPILGTFRTAGRFLAIGVVPLSILSGLGMTAIAERWPRLGPVPSSVLGLAALCWVGLDLGYNGIPQLRRAFPFDPVEVGVRPFVTIRDPLEGFDLATVRARVDAIRGHSNLYYPTGALPQDYPPYRGEAYLESGPGETRLRLIRPNEIEVEVRAERATHLIVNQTHVPGWVRRDRSEEVRPLERRIATPVGPQDTVVRLVYRPETLTTGMVLSALTLVLLATAVVGKRLRRSE